MILDSKIPSGDLADKWEDHKFHMKLINPANRRKHDIIVIGSGLAGASAAATLGGLGYNVSCFCFQDSPRRAHSIAAQGGINAAKNYQGDGDSVHRLFYDTIKGGDFRARECPVIWFRNGHVECCVTFMPRLYRDYTSTKKYFGSPPSQATKKEVIYAYQTSKRHRIRPLSTDRRQRRHHSMRRLGRIPR